MATSPDTSNYYNFQTPGLGSVGSYQIAGTPFITGSTINGGLETEINFPKDKVYYYY